MIPRNLKSKGFHWVFVSMLIISAMLYCVSTFPKCSASVSGSPTIFVDPPQTIHSGMTVGTLFNVSVSIANTTGFAGVQFALSWNATVLTCTKITEVLFHNVTPQDSWTNIWSIGLKFNKTAGTAGYAQTFQDTSAALSGDYAPINVTTANYPEGKTALATLTFNVTNIPPANMIYQSSLALSGVIVGDMNGLPITMTTVDGQYMIYGPPETITTLVPYLGTNYAVTTETNASLVTDSVNFVKLNDTSYKLDFNITGTDGTTAYVNVTIPKALMSIGPSDEWKVDVNGTEATPIVTSDATNWYLYLTTTLSTKEVEIWGTVPEFTMLFIPLLMAATLIAVGLRRRKPI
jgi:hypothetical protein